MNEPPDENDLTDEKVVAMWHEAEPVDIYSYYDDDRNCVVAGPGVRPTTTTTTTSTASLTMNLTWPCGGDIKSSEPCHWEEMHHLDDEGRHWCPTGFMWCSTHGGGDGTIDGPGTCQLWGEKPAA